MGRIRQIPQNIISQIAAGEVIERPMYAVKELIENSLDENATFISTQIHGGGLEKIVVTDDGNGMTPSDLFESFKPHTTSKLVEESLVGIHTLGFRGEALSSIAAVSDMTIQSRARDQDSGTQITIQAGKIHHTVPVGMPYGTVVTVQNLFYSVPARKKFIKSPQTEFRYIMDLITRYSLVYPQIRFLLTHNSRTVLDLPKNNSVEDRLNTIFKKEITSQLLPVRATESYISLEGYISRPQISSKNLSKQYIFVNSRAVSDRQVSAAVRSAYGTVLEKGRYPIFILFLDIPHEVVDINVHPRKEQVKFMSQEVVASTIRSAVQKTLSEHNLVYSDPGFRKYSSWAGTTKSYAADILREKEALWNVKDPVQILGTDTIQQIHDMYLLVQTHKGFLLIDQHAAHERILYEQLLSTYNKSKQKLYVLKEPVRLDLTDSDKITILENRRVLKKVGFEIEDSDPDVFVRSLPVLFKDRNISKLVTEFAEDLAENGDLSTIDTISNTMIAYLACRGAIKAGEKLTDKEAKRLIEKLTETENNTACPHGRPTQIELSVSELNKWFKRG